MMRGCVFEMWFFCQRCGAKIMPKTQGLTEFRQNACQKGVDACLRCYVGCVPGMWDVCSDVVRKSEEEAAKIVPENAGMRVRIVGSA